MNAAEITDKLGLHSLRQRAWVWYPGNPLMFIYANSLLSTFNQLVLPLVTVFTKVWNGWAIHFERLGITREVWSYQNRLLYSSTPPALGPIHHPPLVSNRSTTWFPQQEQRKALHLRSRWLIIRAYGSLASFSCVLVLRTSGCTMGVSCDARFVFSMVVFQKVYHGNVTSRDHSMAMWAISPSFVPTQVVNDESYMM